MAKGIDWQIGHRVDTCRIYNHIHEPLADGRTGSRCSWCREEFVAGQPAWEPSFLYCLLRRFFA